MSAPRNPADEIASSPMTRAQIGAVALAVLLNALDGFDVLSISFAAPDIARGWGIERAALGFVLSMELIGMALGSIILGQFCDRAGRRPTVITCLVIMAAGMALAANAPNIVALSFCRLLTGFGIGGMLAATNALVAEFANDRRRALCVALMAGGYPMGAVAGGIVTSAFLLAHGWHWVFLFGAATTALCIPLSWFLLPETVAWIERRRPRNALARINATLSKLGRAPIESLPPATVAAAGLPLARLFAPSLIGITALLTLAYFAHILTFYFFLKWTPKIVADLGFASSLAGEVLVWANVGGATGAIVVSLLTQRYAVRALTIAAMMGSTVAVATFGGIGADLALLSLCAAITGFLTNGAIVGLYAMFAAAFPTELRASGTGFVIGIGRGGAALGPIIAGLLFARNLPLFWVSIILGLGSLAGALALLALRRSGAHPTAD